MLNQYYEFLSKSLIKWLENQSNLKAGSKYFVLLDNENDTANFYETLQNINFKGKLTFKSKEYQYETVALDSNDTKILFVAPSKKVTQDFLVTVRNKVNANQDEWRNTAVFFIVHTALDSIIGGAYDISQKDAPFHAEKIKGEVEKEISHSRISDSHKLILESYLKEITSQPTTVLKDYETLFSILETEKISIDDFNTMGYFPDSNLETYDRATINKRLGLNRELFEKIEMLHFNNFSDLKERLSDTFQGDGIITELSKEDEWKSIEFSRIQKAKEELDNANVRDIEIESNQIEESDDFFWFRQHGETKTQRRKIHLLISSYNIENNFIQFIIPFDSKLRKRDIKESTTYIYSDFGQKHEEWEIVTQNNNLLVRIQNIELNKTYGGQIQYVHYGMSKFKFTITFMIVPFLLTEAISIRPDFQIKIMGNVKSRRYYYGVANSMNRYTLGRGDKVIIIENKELMEDRDIKDSQLILGNDFSGDTLDDVRFNTRLGTAFFPIELLDVEYKPIPAQALTIERQRISESENQFVYLDYKIHTGSRNISVEKLYQDVLNIEKRIIELNSLYGQLSGNSYEDIKITIPDSINKAYQELFNYYKKEQTTLSLAINNEKHINLLENIINSIKVEFEQNLVHQKLLSPEMRSISLIGTMKDQKLIKFTPLNPMLIAYQLQLYEELKNVESVPREAILSTLNAQNLLPYIQVNNVHYQSTYTRNYPRWLTYSEISHRRLSDLSSNIIKQRLNDYLNQYKFLFETNTQMTLNIAAIDIVDEDSFFDAIINFMVNRLVTVKDIDNINPINLYVNKIGTSINSLFHQLYKLNTIQELNESLKNPLKKNVYTDVEDYEILHFLKQNINIYRLPEEDSSQLDRLFFHITFYQFTQKDNINHANMRDINKNYALSGLVNNSQFSLREHQYLNGFGLGDSDNSESELIYFTAMWNSFISSTNKDTDIYQQDLALVNRIPRLEQVKLEPIFKTSGWVTLLNIDVDLSYFYDENNLELLVIHYSDQNASSQYESVTVTKDISQYEYLLKLHTEEHRTINDVDTKEIIKNFNAINGRWLLKLITDKQNNIGNKNVFREKLSVITAYKQLLGILNHPDIYWVPIALEEVLRVSGMVGLSKTDGLFSAKNLGHQGSLSDDLLMMGIEVNRKETRLHFIPVEVKVGINDSEVRKKAMVQVENTSNILKDFLTDKNWNKFMQKYYLNFFISLMLTNLEKMISSGIYPVDEVPNYEQIKGNLRTGKFTISNEMEEYYGNGIVFEFTKNQTARTFKRLSEKNISLIKVPETDAYNIVSSSSKEIINKIANEEFDFDSNVLLSNQKNIIVKNCHNSEVGELNIQRPILIDESNQKNNYTMFRESLEHEVAESENNYGEFKTEEYEFNKNDPVIGISTPNISQVLNDKRLLLGNVLNSRAEVYWEYGNKGLSNRHLLITGKSGQGKTYLIQTLLYEFSMNALNALVVDYTDSFLPNQLDTKLIQCMENKIHHKIIYQDLMPLNPFKIQKIDIGGILIDEKPLDMVDRVVQIIDFVFNLGVQQRSLLTETILEGYRLNGSSYTFSHLREELQNSDDNSKQNLYGRISSLLKRDPFAYDENFGWERIFDSTGKIHVFQLTGFQRQIQQVMIEFMLWDLFQYSTKTGTEAKPLPIILDEIQNLNFSSNSPMVKILREGRKFGLSGIFATQSLDSIKGSDSEAVYNAAQQIHFLPPESQVKNIAKSLLKSEVSSKEIELQLKTLHKGEAIVNGPVLNKLGDITPPMGNLIKITSLEDRIENNIKS